MSAERAHALLSASAASRWLKCTASVRVEEQLPESTSEYAEEGTLAHAIAELKLRKHYAGLGPRKYSNEFKKLQANPLYQAEMEEHTEAYKDYIASICYALPSLPYTVIEKKLDYSNYAPEGFGTGDFLLIHGDLLHIIDFKYGKGLPVSAEENPQMKLYALGALNAYSMFYGIKRIKMHIFQPRIDNTSDYEMSVEALLAWGESIKPIAQAAFAGLGDFVPGEHCRFCRAKALCRARADKYTALQDFGLKKAELLTLEEIGQILELANNLDKWVSEINEYALDQTLKGNEVPGWKAVEGRSNRIISDLDAAFETITKAGYDEALLYERKPLGLGALEKLLTKKKFDELVGSFVTKPQGKPTLVPINDKREAINRITAEQDFR